MGCVFGFFLGSIVQAWTFILVPSSFWSCTASGSSQAPPVTERPRPSSSVKWFDRWVTHTRRPWPCSRCLTRRLTGIPYFPPAAGSVGPVHREKPVRYDVLHADGTAEAPPTGGRDPQSVSGSRHLQGSCCAGDGDWGFFGFFFPLPKTRTQIWINAMQTI